MGSLEKPPEIAHWEMLFFHILLDQQAGGGQTACGPGAQNGWGQALEAAGRGAHGPARVQDAPLPPGHHARLTLLPIGCWTQGLVGTGSPCLVPWRASVGWREDHTAGPARWERRLCRNSRGFSHWLGGGGPRGSEAWPSSRGPPTGWSAITPARRCLCSGAGGLSPSHSPGDPRSGGPALEVLPRRPGCSSLRFNFGSLAWCLIDAHSAADCEGARGL